MRSLTMVAAAAAGTAFAAAFTTHAPRAVTVRHRLPLGRRNVCEPSCQRHGAERGSRRHAQPRMAFDFTSLGSWLGGGWGSKKDDAGSDFDVVVIGSGPAGAVMATLLAEKSGLRVAIVDPNLRKRWVPNYGVWLEEWEKLESRLQIGLDECLDRTWPVTDCFYGGSHGVPLNERLRIERPYARVSRGKFKAHLTSRMAKAGVMAIEKAADPGSVVHTTAGSQLRLADGKLLRTRMIVDSSGFDNRLTAREPGMRDDPGFQIAYGIECEVAGDLGPYDPEAMLFMDYRTDFAASPEEAAGLSKEPTFMYIMPLGRSAGGKQRVFFEETSLVARPPMTFDECRRRMYRRLAHLGIEVTKVEDEEFCRIPMGSALPAVDQRIVAFGAAAGLVHAATGYQMVRMLAAAGGVADALAAELGGPRGAAELAAVAAGGGGVAELEGFDPDRAARRAYQAMWPSQARLQRDFHVFGGEFLMQQDVGSLRGFFDAFFRTPLPYWAGFLTGYPGLPHNEMHATWSQRFLFGTLLWLQAPPPVKLSLMVSGVLDGWRFGLLRSVLPLSELIESQEADRLARELPVSTTIVRPAVPPPAPEAKAEPKKELTKV